MADSQGTHSNPFSILQNVNNVVLSKLAAECRIVLGESEEAIEMAQATLTKAEKKKEQSKATEEVIEVEEELDEQNEEHLRIIHELEEVDNQSDETGMLEVLRMSQLSQLGNPTAKPK